MTLLQLVFSVIAVAFKWDDELAYAFEASQDLSVISDGFKKLGKFPPEQYNELESEYELLNTRYKSRAQQSSKHNVNEWELRLGMRFGLREFQKECISCKKTPTDMDSTDCGVCGRYKTELLTSKFLP